MPRFSRLLLLATLAAPTALLAQPRGRATSDVAREGTRAGAAGAAGATAPSDPELARAYALVIDGQGKRGRAIVDSLFAATPAGSPRHAEVLYWRAAFAASTADAERDYRRLSVEYPLSNRAADALIALAQLEYVRNDTTLAVHHLQRLMIEHPAGVRSARANFWAARVLFAAADPVRACSALRAARATTGPDEGELRNQIELDVPKCGAAGAARAAGPAAARPAPPARRATAAPATPQVSAADRPAGATTNAGRRYAVQVAAYRARSEADALVARLTQRGYSARVSGQQAPFRVQVGRYATRAEAVAALARVRAAKLDGFVVATDER